MKTDWDVDVTVIKQLWFEAGTTTKKKHDPCWWTWTGSANSLLTVVDPVLLQDWGPRFRKWGSGPNSVMNTSGPHLVHICLGHCQTQLLHEEILWGGGWWNFNMRGRAGGGGIHQTLLRSESVYIKSPWAVYTDGVFILTSEKWTVLRSTVRWMVPLTNCCRRWRQTRNLEQWCHWWQQQQRAAKNNLYQSKHTDICGCSTSRSTDADQLLQLYL